ncbi:MAG: amidohydrolase family protein [Halobacteriales archaeon]
MTHDIVIRNASLDGSDDLVGIAIDDGRIARVADSVGEGDEEIDADGNFVSPGFVDCHMHLDRVCSVCGERVPIENEEPITVAKFNDFFDRYHDRTSLEEIEEQAVRDIQRAVEAGTTYIRSHVSIDHPTENGNIRALVRAIERTEDLVDVQLVPMSAHGVLNGERTEDLLREAIEIGLEHDPSGKSILVGGADPASRNRDIDGTLDVWFDVASEYDVDIDAHIQDSGTLGAFTIERLCEKAEEYGYEGRVTASHSFSLAHLPGWRLDELIEMMNEVDLKLDTCYSSTRTQMPIRRLVESGVALGHGTDNHRDYISPHGEGDTLHAAHIELFKLTGDRDRDQAYRWYTTNPGMDLIWEVITREGARVLDLDGYGIEEGARADLIVLDAPSSQWAIIEEAERSYVIKDGEIVVEDGMLRPEHRVVES